MNGIQSQNSGREKTIVRTSMIGIIANVFLAGFKAARIWRSCSDRIMRSFPCWC